MSSHVKYDFLVFAPDKTDGGAYARRMSVREKHLAGVKSLETQGVTKAGGAMLSPESITGGEKKLIGSVMVMTGETLEEIKKLIENDIYYTSGVWDPERLVITPFQPAIGFGK